MAQAAQKLVERSGVAMVNADDGVSSCAAARAGPRVAYAGRIARHRDSARRSGPLGPATAVVVNGTPYLVDFGAGVVRRAKSAVVDKGIAALDPVKLRVVFVTHLHSDHTVGYPDLILTPWVLGRRVPLEVYGPSGIKAMTEPCARGVQRGLRRRARGIASSTRSVHFPKGTP